MTQSKARIGAGDVEITLDGETKVLKPSLAACLAISRMAGGILGAMHRVSQLDFDAIVHVTKAGLDLTDKGAEGLDEKVYRTGIGYKDGLAGNVTTYLENLANGGKPRKPAGASDDTTNPPL